MKKKYLYAFITVFMVTVIMTACGNGNQDVSGSDSENEAAKQVDNADSDGEDDSDIDSPLYDIAEIPEIDLYAENHEPKKKAAGMEWNRDLFYWLEDADPKSDEDGNISKAIITKSQLRNKETGNIIQYDIYKSPGSGVIYKIVSIEQIGEGKYEITDYYYSDGVPNFIFRRYDSVYTPTYATVDKIGERYYFDADVMVKWRKIDEPGKIDEMLLSPEKNQSGQLDYYEQSDSLKEEYDSIEKRMLNAAYNTYEAVGGTPVGDLEGRVMNSRADGLEDKTVMVFRASDGVLLYKTDTDEDGNYHIYIYLDGEEVIIKINADGEYNEAEENGVIFADTSLVNEYNLILHKEGEEEAPVPAKFTIRTAEDAGSKEGKDEGDDASKGSKIEGAHIRFRYGENNRNGEVVAEADSDSKGNINTELQPGIYTAQIEKEGYETAYVKVTVTDAEVKITVYLIPELKDGETGVLLTWDNPDKDLDLTIFTSKQGERGDMEHIGGAQLSDSEGNRILFDNTRGCEYGIIRTDVSGTYKVYVNNYTDSLAQMYDSTALSGMNIHIYIYNKNGLVADFTIPKGSAGVVWEIAEIAGDQVAPDMRVYENIEDKDWWNSEKVKYENNEDLAAGLFGMEYIGNRRYTEHYQSLDGFAEGWTNGENIGMTLPSDEEAVAAVDRWDFDNDGKDEMLVVTLKPEYGLVERSSYGMYMLEQVADMSWEVADTVSAYTDVYCTYDNPERSEVFVMPDTHGDQVIYVEDFNYGNFADGEFFELQSWIYDGAEFRNKYDTIEDAGSDGTTLMDRINYKTDYFDDVDYYQPKFNLLHEMGFDPDKVGLEDSISSSEGDSRSILKIMRDDDVDWFSQYSDNYQGYMPDANGCFGYIYYKIYDYEDGKEQELS